MQRKGIEKPAIFLNKIDKIKQKSTLTAEAAKNAEKITKKQMGTTDGHR
jgi:hypothetical protein